MSPGLIDIRIASKFLTLLSESQVRVAEMGVHWHLAEARS